MLCHYEAERNGAQLEQLRRQHPCYVEAPAVYDDGRLRITRIDGGLRLAGEVDLTNRAALADALAASAGDDPLVVDVASLRFLELASLRLLASGVVVRNPSPQLRRLLTLLSSAAPGEGSAGEGWSSR